ncbi:MAG: MAPEG family protein [Pseudomonadota bacterium]
MPIALEARLSLWAIASLIASATLAIAIARLARHRFLEPDDRDPSHGQNSHIALGLQNQVQNTLEQLVLAVIVYGAWIALVPVEWGNAVVPAAVLFAIGRMLFFIGYGNGATARALGFTLTFYPTIALAIGVVAALVIYLAGL